MTSRSSSEAVVHQNGAGFTLIELSIVLVIIGLIVGGVLVGADLIDAAKIRGQVSQIEKFNVAVNTFRLKYNCLPGDCRDAANYGFPARSPNPGRGDGNGVMQGNYGAALANNIGNAQNGENLLLWVDLSMAGLIEGSFTAASNTSLSPIGNFDTTNLYQILPRSKLSDSTYVAVTSSEATGLFTVLGDNYWAIDGFNTIVNTGNIMGLGQIWPPATHNIKVSHATAIDQKMDDGLPLTGKVTAQWIPSTGGTTGNYLRWTSTASSSVAAAASATTCYDNQNNTANPVTYSMSYKNGSAQTCALAFKW